MKKKNKQFTIKKENFIEFLASSSPEEVSKLIEEKGKPAKLVEPMIFFSNSKDKKE